MFLSNSVSALFESICAFSHCSCISVETSRIFSGISDGLSLFGSLCSFRVLSSVSWLYFARVNTLTCILVILKSGTISGGICVWSVPGIGMRPIGLLFSSPGAAPSRDTSTVFGDRDGSVSVTSLICSMIVVPSSGWSLVWLLSFGLLRLAFFWPSFQFPSSYFRSNEPT